MARASPSTTPRTLGFGCDDGVTEAVCRSLKPASTRSRTAGGSRAMTGARARSPWAPPTPRIMPLIPANLSGAQLRGAVGQQRLTGARERLRVLDGRRDALSDARNEVLFVVGPGPYASAAPAPASVSAIAGAASVRTRLRRLTSTPPSPRPGPGCGAQRVAAGPPRRRRARRDQGRRVRTGTSQGRAPQPSRHLLVQSRSPTMHCRRRRVQRSTPSARGARALPRRSPRLRLSASAKRSFQTSAPQRDRLGARLVAPAQRTVGQPPAELFQLRSLDLVSAGRSGVRGDLARAHAVELRDCCGDVPYASFYSERESRPGSMRRSSALPRPVGVWMPVSPLGSVPLLGGDRSGHEVRGLLGELRRQPQPVLGDHSGPYEVATGQLVAAQPGR